MGQTQNTPTRYQQAEGREVEKWAAAGPLEFKAGISFHGVSPEAYQALVFPLERWMKKHPGERTLKKSAYLDLLKQVRRKLKKTPELINSQYSQSFFEMFALTDTRRKRLSIEEFARCIHTIAFGTSAERIQAVFHWLDSDSDGFISPEDVIRGCTYNRQLVEDFLTERLFTLKDVRDECVYQSYLREFVRKLLGSFNAESYKKFVAQIFGKRQELSLSEWTHLALAEPTTLEDANACYAIQHFVNIRIGHLTRMRWRRLEEVHLHQVAPVLISKEEGLQIEMRLARSVV